MAPRQIMIITGLLLATAVVSLAGIGYPTMHVSTTSTVITLLPQYRTMYPQYALTNSGWFSSTGTFTYIFYNSYAAANLNGPPYETYGVVPYSTTTYVATQPFYSTYEFWTSSSVTDTQMVNRPALTTTLVNYSPAYLSLGLTESSFAGLTLGMVIILGLLSVWILLNKGSKGPKQATLTLFVNQQKFCIKCAAELPPASSFCNKCGAKQE